ARVAGTAPLAALLQAVEAAGYRARPAPKDAAGEAAEERAEMQHLRGELVQFAAAALLTLPLGGEMAAELLGFSWMMSGWLQAVLAAPVQFWTGGRFYHAACWWRSALTHLADCCCWDGSWRRARGGALRAPSAP